MSQFSRDNYKRRKSIGTMAIELTGGSLFLIVLSLLFVDVSVMMLGFQVNDRACRDACRAAAQQSSSSQAIAAAKASLNMHKADGNFVTNPTLLTDPANFVYQDFGGNPTAGNPTVTVTSECKVKLPVPLVFCGQGLDNSGNYTFRKRYTFPIVAFNLQL